MNPRLVNTNRISISNFTFDDKTNTISFFSTKTNKCWSIQFSNLTYRYLRLRSKKANPSQKELNLLKKLCKNGNN